MDRSNVVITGAAGALGRDVVRHFQEAGARLALIDKSAGSLMDAFPELDTSRHLLLDGDLLSPREMEEVTARIRGHFGHVDVLIHLAGGFEMGEDVRSLSRASWDRMMEINAWSFVAVVQSILPLMLNQEVGRIVAVSAKVAERGMANMAAYIASKSALQRIVESLAHELGDHGICVNSVAPNVLDTPANRRAMPDADTAGWVSTAAAARTVGFLASSHTIGMSGRHLVLAA